MNWNNVSGTFALKKAAEFSKTSSQAVPDAKWKDVSGSRAFKIGLENSQGIYMSEPESQLPASTEVTTVHQGKINWWRWFWITALVVSLPYAWYCFYVPSNHIAWADSYDVAQQRAARSGKPMILFFTGDWCVPCRIMKRNVWADEQVATSVNAAFILLTIDVDASEASAVLKRYNVGSTPNTIITDSQGNVLNQKAGAIGKAEFLELIGKLNSTAAND